MILSKSALHASQMQKPEKLYKGLDRFAHSLIGRSRRRESMKEDWLQLAYEIHKESFKYQDFSNKELTDRLKEARDIFRRQKLDFQSALPQALALIVATADRTLGKRPFPVQILGAIMIYHGYLAEMATGEGKTLTACLPAILFAWSGKPCHVITANDYLAGRDAEEMAQLYRFCQIRCGWVGGQMAPAERKENYSRGIVYTTSKELLADFLRDQLLLGPLAKTERRTLLSKLPGQDIPGVVMRGIGAAIVDEADSVLIDEAVTPLIISQPQQNQPLTEAILIADRLAAHLKRNQDYCLNVRFREIKLTAAGKQKVASQTETLDGIWRSESRREEMIVTALTAKELYKKDQQYVVQDDQVVIVDEFTGRMMPQRSWRQGLHQAIEARENLPLSDPNETLARLSFQRFFRLFDKLGGMTGTGREATEEFWQIYNLPVLCVPTNRPCIRQQLPNRYYPDMQSKWQAICAEITDCHQSGQPVLVGTRSIAASEQLAALLADNKIPCQLLNAVRHREEADIIATAGQLSKVTIATNMAGRGADIKLGKGVSKLGGLHVIVSERHESQRIDRQLIGRCARQGQPGSYRIYSSLEDEILQRYGLKPLINLLRQKLTTGGDENLPLFEKALSLAQLVAQKQAFSQRKSVMQTDDWLSDALSFARTDLAQ